MTDARHTLVVGDSGGGKTTYLREVHATWRGVSIWVNHNGETVPDGRGSDDATTVSTFDDLDDAVRDGARTINYHAPQEEGIQHARSIGYHATDQPLQVIVDEVQNALPSNVEQDAPLKVGMHEDRDQHVRYVIATQDPQDVDYGAIKQCKWVVWVGQWAQFHEGFIRYYGLDRANLPDERFEYVVLDKQAKVVHRGTTNEEYAK